MLRRLFCVFGSVSRNSLFPDAPGGIQHPLLYTLGSMLLDGWGNAVPHEEFSGIPPRHAVRKRSLEEARGEESVPGLWTEEGKVKHSSPSPPTSLPCRHKSRTL